MESHVRRRESVGRPDPMLGMPNNYIFEENVNRRVNDVMARYNRR